MKKWLALDEADLQDESKFSTTDYNNLENGIKKALNRRSYSLEDLRCEKSNADKVAEAFGITLLKARLDENLIRQYRKLKVQDLAADFCDYREQLLQKTREECSRRKVAFQSAKDGTDTLSKEAEKARLEKENLEEEKQHIESALEELRKFTNLKIRGLSFSKKGR